jgi:hypothetical protein
MNQVTVTDKAVKITIGGLNKLWAFKGMLTIPRDTIEKVSLRSKEMRPPWRRARGTHLPNVFAAGTYHGSEGKEFWNTHFRDDCVVFDLEGFDYSRVVIDVSNAQKLIETLS